MVRNEIEITQRIGLRIIDCGMEKFIFHHQTAADQFQRPAGAESMPGHGFGGAHRDLNSGLAERKFYDRRFAVIAVGYRDAVRIDIAELAGLTSACARASCIAATGRSNRIERHHWYASVATETADFA